MESHRQELHPTLYHKCVCRRLFETEEQLQKHLKEHETVVCSSCGEELGFLQVIDHKCESQAKSVANAGQEMPGEPELKVEPPDSRRDIQLPSYLPSPPPTVISQVYNQVYNYIAGAPGAPDPPLKAHKSVPKIFTYSYEQAEKQPVSLSQTSSSDGRSAAGDVTGSTYYSRSFACTFPGCYKRFTREYDLERHAQAEDHY